MFRTTAAALVLTLATSVAPAFAADADREAADARDANATASSVSAPLAGEVDWSMKPVKFGGPSRGGLLPTLYVRLAGLNAFDGYTTSKGLSLGATEANSMMRGVAGNAAALWAVKGGVTAGTVFVAERLWKKNNKAGAIAVMLISNGMMATVAARNTNVIRQQQMR
jgi:hypothetical protein